MIGIYCPDIPRFPGGVSDHTLVLARALEAQGAPPAVLARRGSLDRPDWAILDLDPKGAPFEDVVALARYIHELLDASEAPHYIKTSGQAGLHVLLPLGRTLDHVEARTLAEVIARVVQTDNAEIATVARAMNDRGGKVYVDYLQNRRGQLLAAPWCVRPLPGAPVSTPLRWREVGPRLVPDRALPEPPLTESRPAPHPVE